MNVQLYVCSEMLAILSSAKNIMLRHCAQVAVGFDTLSGFRHFPRL